MQCAQLFSCILLFVILWTVACQAPLSMGFSRQGYWSGVQFSFPTQGPNLCFLHLLHWQVNSLPLSHLGSPLYVIHVIWPLLSRRHSILSTGTFLWQWRQSPWSLHLKVGICMHTCVQIWLCVWCLHMSTCANDGVLISSYQLFIVWMFILVLG